MTFTELEYFVETYQQKSISKAAENLYVVPSVVSAAIKRLEKEFQVNLFNRSANRLHPTPAGDKFYLSALEILLKAGTLKHDMSEFSPKHSAIQTIKIALNESLNVAFGQKILHTFSCAYPNINVSLFDIADHEKSYYQAFDIIIESLRPKIFEKRFQNLLSVYSAKTLLHSALYLWIAADSPLLKHKDLSLDALEFGKFITLKQPHNILDSLNYVNKTYNPSIVLEKDFIRFIEQLDYYTLDILNEDQNSIFKKLQYNDLFKDKAILSKKLTDTVNTYIIYKTESMQVFIPLIADIFTSNISNES